jgi:hypothetical protein
MARKKNNEFIDLGRVESEKFEPNEEVRKEFDEAAQLGLSGGAIEKMIEHHSTSPKLSGGDVDAAWEDADVGEESVGGGNPTPDQSIVEELGEAMGLHMKTTSRFILRRRLKSEISIAGNSTRLPLKVLRNG